jgi:hypothetical protein
MTQTAAPQQVSIDSLIYAELEYIVQLHQAHGAPYAAESVEHLVAYVLRCVADGSRRPGSWERGLLESMGLVADTDDHHVYRSNYGPEASTGEVDE